MNNQNFENKKEVFEESFKYLELSIKSIEEIISSAKTDEDLKKAQFYLNRIFGEVQNQTNKIMTNELHKTK